MLTNVEKYLLRSVGIKSYEGLPKLNAKEILEFYIRLKELWEEQDNELYGDGKIHIRPHTHQ